MNRLTIFTFKRFGWFCCLITWITLSTAQPYPASFFGLPLTLQPKLSGNFGEIRSSHFHSGLDFKTDSAEGKPVLAAAAGYISRIKVSATGFGKALYITHPNGYVTVYGHLHQFTDRIRQFVEAEQYRKEVFEVELLPDSGLFMVAKGELIAFSGNTGGSQGPHLHFEIRDAQTEKPINPLLFGYSIPDTVAPVLTKILFRPLDSRLTENPEAGIELPVNPALPGPDSIQLTGLYGLSFSGYDLAGEETNQLGIYEITLLVEDSAVYIFRQTTFAFDETRYVNAHIEYDKKVRSRETFERCYRLPGDLFSLNALNKEYSLPEMLPGKSVHLNLILKDFSGNRTERKLLLLGATPAKKKQDFQSTEERMTRESQLLRYSRENNINKEGVSIHVPKGALYRDELIHVAQTGLHHPLYPGQQQYVVSAGIPFHTPYTLSLKENHFPVLYRHKACIVLSEEKGQRVYIGGSFKSDSITVRTRSLGVFYTTLDTLPPRIEEFQLSADSLFNQEILSVRISDDLSGMASYRATLDGKWKLMEFDEKKSMLFFTFDSLAEVINKTLRIEVTDRKENRAVYETVIKK